MLVRDPIGSPVVLQLDPNPNGGDPVPITRGWGWYFAPDMAGPLPGVPSL
jgi:hypothetical protein